MSYDYLVDHALKNVWCTPNQDMQAVVKPARLTPYGGAWNSLRVLHRMMKLPEAGPRFHVYQIGQIHPLLMGLLESDQVWTTFADACTKSNLIVDLYANSGVQFPRFQSWYTITPEKNLIVAVKLLDQIPVDLNAEPLFVRLYSNAYFSSDRSDPLNDYIKVEGAFPVNTDAILTLQQKFTTYQSLPGTVYAFVNGMKVSGIDLITTKPEDAVEIVYDSSVLHVLDFAVKDLPEFVSTLDKKHKYLLHYPGDGDLTIDFLDDNDLFLIKKTPAGRHQGVYYHRNMPDAVRMLSHKDYSIPVPYLLGYTEGRAGWEDPDTLTVRMHIRKSGYQRAIVNENNRIKELYKLPDEKILRAMIGVDATVDNWTAANLENSAYTQVMRTVNQQDVTRDLVQKAYGYNAISSLIGSTPKVVSKINGSNGVRVPHGLFRNATAYEYDATGILKTWNFHDVGTVFYTYNAQSKLVEMVAGVGDASLDEVYGEHATAIDPTVEYRMYVCKIENGVPNNEWQDVTDSGMYAKIDNKVTWLVNPAEYYTLLRGNRRFLAYDLKLSMAEGVLKFTLTHFQTRNGVRSNWPMQIPLGEWDIFLNGHSLIEGLDYVMNFPEVVIINKKHLVNPETDLQRITVRGMGFCKKDLSYDKPKDVGFVQYGLLSHNNRFDIRDDKVMRIVLGGATVDRSALKFSEDSPAVLVPDALNGTPYMLRDIVVPLRGNALDDTYALRAEAQVIDKRISDYMTQFLPEPVQTTPNAIPDLYPVFSPFLCKVIYDLRSGVLNDPRLTTAYSDNDVKDICQPYEYLLPFDPTQAGQEPDPNYVAIHPHNLLSVIQLNLFQYRFVLRVVRLYLNDAVDVSHFLAVST
jgi:hypothetical protein